MTRHILTQDYGDMGSKKREKRREIEEKEGERDVNKELKKWGEGDVEYPVQF